MPIALDLVQEQDASPGLGAAHARANVDEHVPGPIVAWPVCAHPVVDLQEQLSIAIAARQGEAPWAAGQWSGIQRCTLPCADASALTERSVREAWPEPLADTSARRVAAAIPPPVLAVFDVGAALFDDGAAVAGAAVGAVGVLGVVLDVVRLSAPPAWPMP